MKGHQGKTAVPGTVLEHCEVTSAGFGVSQRGLVGFSWLLWGQKHPASFGGTGKWEVLLCSRKTKAGKCNHPTARSDQSFSNQLCSTLPGAEKHLRASGCLGLCWGHREGTGWVGEWGGRDVGQRWGCLMSMSQPGGCLTQPSTELHPCFGFFNHYV